MDKSYSICYLQIGERIDNKEMKYSHKNCPHPESLNKKCEEGITITDDYRIIPTIQVLELEDILYDKNVKCPMCNGEKTIRIPIDVIDDCPQCEGTGKVSK